MNSENEWKFKVAALIKEVFSEVLNIPLQQLKDDVTFDQYGVDSLIVMDINKRLESYFGSLPTTLLFEHRNLEQLTGYFIEKYSEACEKICESNQAKINVIDREESIVETNNVLQITNDRWKKKESKEKEPPKLLMNFYNEINKNDQPKPVDEDWEEDIAIIGISGRYPNSPNLNAFWENLKNGNSCITEIPKDRWDCLKHYDSNALKKGTSYSKWGGFIEGADEFDPLFFNISPREAEAMDPQERLMLETAWNTMEDAGYTSKKIKKHQQKVGVFVGAMNSDYEFIAGEQWGRGNLTGAHTSFWSMANRISYLLDLQGPSYTIDTACSSSLTALHLACASLKNKECELALAGGVNLILHPIHFIRLCGMNMLSKDECLKSFGIGADGFVDGEGVGAVLLKPLSKAKRDHDCIRGVIKASWVNAGGRTNGYTVPNPVAQADLINAAFEKAHISPNTISYIEAHGTGTELGDPIEIAGLTRAFSMSEKNVQKSQYCAVGSVKSNIGHLESAAGIASVTKVLLMMKHKKLIPTIHCETLNPGLKLENTPFYIERDYKDWNVIEETSKRRAGISSFGAGGANAHLILEEYQAVTSNNVWERNQYLFVISAKTKHQVKEYAKCLIKHLEEEPGIELWNVAYTLQTGREAMNYRMAVIAHDVYELIMSLNDYVINKINSSIFEGESDELTNEFSFMMKDDDYKELLDNWLKKEKYEQLANLWVKGGEIDWERMYAKENKPYTISLPTYIFDNKRYWIKIVDNVIQPNFPQNIYMPLLQHKYQYPLLKQVVYDSNINLNTVSYFKDHKINGEYIVSGSTYLSMALDAIEKKGENDLIEIDKVIFHKPTVMTEDKNLHMQFYLTGDNKENSSFKIANIHENQDYDLNVVGKISCHKEKEKIDIITFEQTLTSEFTEVSRDEFYHVLEKQNVELGTQYRWLDKLYVGKEKAVIQLKKPNILEDNYKIRIHPGLIDSLFQACSLTLYGNEITTDTFVPYSIDKFKVFGQMEEEGLWASIYLKSADYNIGEMTFDMDVYQNKYKVLEIRGLSARRVNGQKIKNYKVVWEKKESGQVKSDKKTFIIFSEKKETSYKIIKELKQRGSNCYIIYPGKAYEKISEQEYVISVENPENYKKVLKDFEYDEIIYTWGLSYKNFDLSIEAFKQQQNYSIQGLLFLIQNLGDKSKELVLWTIARCTQQVENNPISLNTSYATLKGICLAAMYEYPKIKIEMIDMDMEESYENVICEIQSGYKDNMTAFRKGERYVARLEEVKTDLKEYESCSIDSQKCYMITGGLGALGLLTAEWLAKNGAHSIILLGRNQPSDRAKVTIQSMQARGVDVQVMNVDVCNKDSLKQVFDEIDRQKLVLGGVIHSAGCIDDAYILNQTMMKMEKVLAPKVEGLLHLHELTLNRSLDFFICYSSASSLIGSQGQVNYIVANTVLDTIMQQRNYMGLPGITINWGAWDRGLVRKESESSAYYDLLGLELLDENDIDILKVVLAYKEAQIGLLKVDWKKLINVVPQTMKDHYFSNFSQKSNVTDNEKIIKSEDVKTYICELLGFTEEEIPMNEPLIKLGLDSISASEIIHYLNTNTQVKLQVVQLLEGMTLTNLLEKLKKETDYKLDKTERTNEESHYEMNDEHRLQNKSMAELSVLVDNIDSLSDEELDQLLGNL
jgi:3-oxoacyl-(acyl-carrier-protein) synthase/acyl carrier protein